MISNSNYLYFRKLEGIDGFYTGEHIWTQCKHRLSNLAIIHAYYVQSHIFLSNVEKNNIVNIQ